MSVRLKFLKQWIRFTIRRDQNKNIFELRDDFSKIFTGYATNEHVGTSIITHKSPSGVWYTPQAHVKKQIILYFHGGGMCLGGHQTHAHLVSEIAHISQMRVFFLNYHLSPEYPYPRALNDAKAAFEYLTSCGYEPKNISLCGDSSGGLLALGLCQLRKMENKAMPNCIALLAPATSSHICFQDDMYSDWETKDPVLNLTQLRRYATAYLAGHSPLDPLCSPIYSNLTGYPPIFSIIGDIDMLIEPLRQLHLAANFYGVKNKMDIQKGAFHGHYLWFKFLPEGREALRKVSSFMMEHALVRQQPNHWKN